MDPNPGQPGAPGTGSASRRRRPLIERLGMAAIALVMATLFGVVAIASFAGGEPFLGTMALIGTFMVLWVGAITLLRG